MPENPEQMKPVVETSKPQEGFEGISDSRIEALLSTEYFESEDEAAEYIKNLDEVLETQGRGQEAAESFNSKFSEMITETGEQISEIERLGAGGELEDKGDLFQDVLSGLAERYEGDVNEKGGETGPGLIEFAKKLASNRKLAFIGVGLFRIAAMGLFAPNVEAGDFSEGEILPDLTPDITPDDIKAEFDMAMNETDFDVERAIELVPELHQDDLAEILQNSDISEDRKELILEVLEGEKGISETSQKDGPIVEAGVLVMSQQIRDMQKSGEMAGANEEGVKLPTDEGYKEWKEQFDKKAASGEIELMPMADKLAEASDEAVIGWAEYMKDPEAYQDKAEEWESANREGWGSSGRRGTEN